MSSTSTHYIQSLQLGYRNKYIRDCLHLSNSQESCVRQRVRYAYTSCNGQTYNASWTRFSLSTRYPYSFCSFRRSDAQRTFFNRRSYDRDCTLLNRTYSHPIPSLTQTSCTRWRNRIEGTTHWLMRFNGSIDRTPSAFRSSHQPRPYSSSGLEGTGRERMECVVWLLRTLYSESEEDSSSSTTVFATNNSSSCSLATVLGASAIKS